MIPVQTVTRAPAPSRGREWEAAVASPLARAREAILRDLAHYSELLALYSARGSSAPGARETIARLSRELDMLEQIDALAACGQR